MDGDVTVTDAPRPPTGPPVADLLVRGARLVATLDDARRELPGGWVAVTGGLVSGVGTAGDPEPAAARCWTPPTASSRRGW